MKFHAARTGHIRNAKELLRHDGQLTDTQLDAMPDDEVERLISERFVAVVLQEEASDYDEIYLVAKGEWSSIIVINR